MYTFIQAEKSNYGVEELCANLGVSRSGYYKWLRAEPSRHARDDERLGAEIRAIHRTSKQRYGSPRVHAELHNQGRAVGRKRVARLMRESGLSGLVAPRFRRTTDSNHKHPVAPNLLGWNFSANAPDRVWVGDISVPQISGVGDER